jgi:hypothetical protein
MIYVEPSLKKEWGVKDNRMINLILCKQTYMKKIQKHE